MQLLTKKSSNPDRDTKILREKVARNFCFVLWLRGANCEFGCSHPSSCNLLNYNNERHKEEVSSSLRYSSTLSANKSATLIFHQNKGFRSGGDLGSEPRPALISVCQDAKSGRVKGDAVLDAATLAFILYLRRRPLDGTERGRKY